MQREHNSMVHISMVPYENWLAAAAQAFFGGQQAVAVPTESA